MSEIKNIADPLRSFVEALVENECRLSDEGYDEGSSIEVLELAIRLMACDKDYDGGSANVTDYIERLNTFVDIAHENITFLGIHGYNPGEDIKMLELGIRLMEHFISATK